MNNSAKIFYLFLGLHSFLLGLFPFFLPVYLFKNGADLAQISWFICYTGIGFSITLWLWDHLRTSSCLISVIVSIALESILLFLVLQGGAYVLIALINGAYSCLYWTIQRVLFLEGGNSDNSGRRFGNLQIFVLIVLKTGIIIGSLLLETGGLYYIFSLSLLVGLTGVALFFNFRRELGFPTPLLQQKPISLREIATFSDGCNSRIIFAVDGIFLYFESYFWLISLFIIVQQSFARLGILIIALALLLAVLFYFIKNRIDRIDKQRLYIVSVVAYAFSWGLRGSVLASFDYTVQISLLLLIAFCTSFFRLAFNKRFFDTAQKSSQYKYILLKSYYSQFCLAIFFALLAWKISNWEDAELVLSYCYMSAGLFAFVYLVFRPIGQIQCRSVWE